MQNEGKSVRGDDRYVDRTAVASGAMVRAKMAVPWQAGCFLVLVSVFFSIMWSSAVIAGELLNRSPGWLGTTLAGAECYGNPKRSDLNFGRYDYLSQRNQIAIVENFHFTRDVQQLAQHDKQIEGNLDYTLKWIPNHHRALWLKSVHYLRLLEDETKRKKLAKQHLHREGYPPPECYFYRGKAFNSSDGMVPAIFGIYLHKMKKLDAALAEYELAERLLPNHPEITYNKGLLYVDMGKLDKAREYAKRAQALGYPFKGLHRKVKEASNEEISVTE